ncbi:ABC transporter permease [Bradyrhizobium sp. NP1]|uniref:ABC transporter permease n=1 Tax=Bradyrhizobium sp. NP1 TaxID=3049772 RepID=UPI0025A511CF|nr:ABC transporter permease [Bradyrhizobium sp. NP1]WJR76576.1 ABC transporter permease [Bradyrhizobium sp. NP1]
MTTILSRDAIRIVADDRKPPSPLVRLVRSEAFAAVASPALILVVWELMVRAHLLDFRFFPSPSSVILELFELVQSGQLFVDIGWTVLRVLIGTLLGTIPGLVLGVLLGLSPVVRAFVQPAINALYPIPKIAMFPLVMMIFGIGEASKWIIVAIAVFFQMFFSTLAGVINIEKIYLDVASNFKASRWQTYRTIAVPGALPFIFTGLQLGVGMALIVVVIAENFGTQVGVGYMIWRSWQVFEVRDMYVGLIVVAGLGYCFQLLLQQIQKRVIPWKAQGGT